MQLAGRILRSVIQKPFILVLLPKETAAMNPKTFAAGSVPLDWCTNICAAAWERQGGCGSDGRGRWSGGLPALAGLEYGGASQPVWAPQAVLQAGLEVGVWWSGSHAGRTGAHPGTRMPSDHARWGSACKPTTFSDSIAGQELLCRQPCAPVRGQ